MSNRSDRANFLNINCVQELPENELVVSATRERTSVEDQDMNTSTNSKAAVRD